MKEYRNYKYFLPNIIGIIVSFVLLILINIFTAVIFFTGHPELLHQTWNEVSKDIALAGLFLIPANCIIFFWVAIVIEILFSFVFHFFIKNSYEMKRKKLMINVLISPIISLIFYTIVCVLGVAVLFLL